jgi:hypothetical protein
MCVSPFRKVETMDSNDPNVEAAIEAAKEFIAEHPDVPIVEVPEVEEGGSRL